MPFGQHDMECGPKCRSKRHAQDLNAAITRGNLKEIQAYFRLCHNAGCVSDTFNRTALHLAASCGKLDVVEWLSSKKVDPALKDEESGYTALHRAVFYGQLGVARTLLQGVPDLSVRDREGLGPLDIVVKDRPAYMTFSKKGQNEVYSWGDNSNLTLGHSVEQRRPVPEHIDTFRKLQLTVQQVVLCKYHTVFLTACGKVLTCGHGQGGRLGHNEEQTCLVPRVVEVLEKEVCVQVAAARDHTVFRTEGGAVFTCGLNDCHQLGQFPAPPKSLSPKQINSKVFKGKKVTGILAGRFHTAITTSQPGAPDTIYTFGLNAGQLGHSKGEIYQSQPRLVAALNHPHLTIQRVACSDAAIVCMTSQGDIYVLHEYQCRKIASKWQETVKIEVSGGSLDHHADRDVLRESGGTQLTIALLSPVGNVFVWRESSQTVTRCHWAIRRPLYIADMTFSSQNMLLVTEDGEAFTAHYSQRKSPNQSHFKGQESGGGDNFAEMTLLDLLLKDDLEEFHVNRIPFIYRATSVTTDRKGRNFVITQTPPNASLTDVPCVSGSTMTSDLRVLLEEVDHYDLIHDVFIKVGEESFPAHKYILAYRSEYFRKLFDEPADDSDEIIHEIQLDDEISPHLFSQLLLFIYTDSCDFLRIGARCDLPRVQYSKANNAMFDFESHFDLQNSPPIDTLSSQKKQSGQKAKNKPKKKNGLKVKEIDEQKKTTNSKTVKVLQDLAKKFGLKDLSKRLDYVKCVDGVIQSTGKSLPKPHIKFERKKLSCLYDVSIRGEDGHVVQCHKCIAVARLEYFHSMMASGWIETSNTSALSLPIPGDILETVLDFLYVGDSPAIRACTDMEKLCNVLVVSDHLLITALKEICEVALVALLTLKNAADMLEFASMYNATQLRSTCQQFICLNLATILEARGLDCLSDVVIGELTEYYRTMVPGMCRRQITPYDEGPSREFLEALAADFHGEDDDVSMTHESAKKKTKSKKKRNRQKSASEESNSVSFNLPVFPKRAERQMSVSSETSVKSEDNFDITPEEVIFEPEVSLDTKTLAMSPEPSNPWGAVSSPVSFTQPTSPIKLRGQVEPHKEITPKSQSSTPKKTTKLSQKERKKLLANQNEGLSKIQISPSFNNTPNAWGDSTTGQATCTSPGATPCPREQYWQSSNQAGRRVGHPSWYRRSSVTKVVQSFRDLILQEKDVSKPIRIPTSQRETNPIASPTSPGDNRKISWGLPTSTVKRGRSVSVSSDPASPSSPTENPWLSKSPLVSKSSLSFYEIVQDERQKHDNLVKNINKPLSLIQIEERAMQELLQHYKAEETYDEQITVERVTAATATPLWAVDRK